MDKKKIIFLISGICGLLVGITIIVLAIIDVTLPKPLWILFSASCLINVVSIISNYKKKSGYKKNE
ncbi:MAG: hypothetical protein K6B68_07595 [Eubacterium sp.]|nr:hypothetical protein [Eubacterium sp.]